MSTRADVPSARADPGSLHEARNLAAEVAQVAHRRKAMQLHSELRPLAAAVPTTATVAVVGERSRGKSTLLNALLGAKQLLPTEVDVTTNTHLLIAPLPSDQSPRARVHFVDGQVQDIDLSASRSGASPLTQYASEAENRFNRLGVSYIEILHRHPLLDEGLRFLDTPGVGGLLSAHGNKTLEAIAAADALLMVLDASQPITEDEIEFLVKAANRSTDLVLLVHNKADNIDDPERILAFNRQALSDRAPEFARAPMVAVSATKAIWALDERDEDPEYARQLDEESGMADLVGALRRDVLAQVVHARAIDLTTRVKAALDELARPDRELIEAVEGASDVEPQLRAKKRERERFADHPPLDVVRRQLTDAAAELDQEFEEEFDDLQYTLEDRIDLQWSSELGKELPASLQTEVDALWDAAMNDLNEAAADIAAALFQDYGVDLFEAPVPEGSPRLTLAPRRLSASGTRPAPTGTATVRRWMRRAGALLSSIMMGNPFTFGLVFAEEGREQEVAEQREARKYVGRLLKDARRAARRALKSRARSLQDELLAELEPRHAAHLESMDATLRALGELQHKVAGRETAEKRLAALQPLMERHDALVRRLEAAVS